MTSAERIKEKIDIVDLIGSYISLSKTGENFKGKCPFHNEKTASFFVSPERQSFYCFGCATGGDVFTFVEKYEGHDFRGVLKILADRAGITLEDEKYDKNDKDEKTDLLRVLEESTKFFESNLDSNAPALEYLKGRGLKIETIKSFRIGFALKSWSDLSDYLIKKGFDHELMYKAGLVKKKEDRYYDAFRSRIMFPLYDSAGRVIAFSGRIFDDESEAKYINSPETAVFTKGEVLYGFDRAKHEIRKKDYCILVEGQMDLVMSHQEGYSNTVASSGTAFGEKALTIIGRLTKNILLVLDADSAGIAASGRIAKIALPSGFNVKSALLPKGTDPADVLKSDIESWRASIKNSKHIIDFYIELLEKAKYDERKFTLEVGRIVLPYVALLENKLDQAYYIRKIAERLRTPENAVWSEVAKIEKKPVIAESIIKKAPIIKEGANLEKLATDLKIYSDHKGLSETSSFIKERFREITGFEIPEHSGDQEKVLFEINMMTEQSDVDKIAREVIQRLEIEKIGQELERITGALKKAELEGDEKEASKYLKEFQDLALKLQKAKIA